MANRKKMLNIRVSEDEYHGLEDACERRGIESVSELMRTTMQHILSSSPPTSGGYLRMRVNELADEICVLRNSISGDDAIKRPRAKPRL